MALENRFLRCDNRNKILLKTSTLFFSWLSISFFFPFLLCLHHKAGSTKSKHLFYHVANHNLELRQNPQHEHLPLYCQEPLAHFYLVVCNLDVTHYLLLYLHVRAASRTRVVLRRILRFGEGVRPQILETSIAPHTQKKSVSCGIVCVEGVGACV